MMTPRTIEMLVKRVINRATGTRVSDIRYAHSLAGDYGFGTTGRQVLAASLNGAFAGHGTPIAPPLGPTETQASVTVGDLGRLIRNRFGV